MRLLDEVYLIGSGLGGLGTTDPFDCNVYLIHGGDEAVIVDAGIGPATEAMVAAIAQIVDVANVRHLVVTHAHPDHSGAAWRWRKLLPHLRIAASPAVARWVREGDEAAMSVETGKRAEFYPPDFGFTPCPVDDEVGEGDTIPAGSLELSVVETRGHADGHISLVCDLRGKKMLFCGDVVFFGGYISLVNNWDCRIQEYAATMAKLAALDADALFPGHHSVDLSRGARHIEAAHRRFESGFVPRSIV